MTVRYIWLCAAVITSLGCAPLQPSPGTLGGISLHVQPEAARPGQTVVLRLVNEHSPEQLGYNLCTSHLERRSGDAWEPVPSDRVCTMELRTLDPDRSADYEFTLPVQLAAGEYRVVTTVFVLQTDDRVQVTSNPLRIE